MVKNELLQGTREIEIDELQDCITSLICCDGVENFKITEAFITKEKEYEAKEYTLYGLDIEVEDGIVSCCDLNEDIYKEHHVLMGFLLDNVKIYRYDKITFELVFPDGLIIIRAILP